MMTVVAPPSPPHAPSSSSSSSHVWMWSSVADIAFILDWRRWRRRHRYRHYHHDVHPHRLHDSFSRTSMTTTATTTLSMGIAFIVMIVLIVSLIPAAKAAEQTDPRSPYYQHLPDCALGKYPTITKKTSTKGIVCPMIKDETGFLSEWVAYHEMQGFDHVIFYDNNSTMPLDELNPWIQTGFVEIRKNWWQGRRELFKNPKKRYYDMMAIKLLAEHDCKQVAVSMGIEVFVSVDLDEYLVPRDSSQTVMDEWAAWFNKSTRGFANVDKLQFPATPHVQEPVNLLTIEAYQTRMKSPNRMNYYTGVSTKVAIRLFGAPDYTNRTTEMLIKCCDFHGCANYDFFKSVCRDLIAAEFSNIAGKHRPYLPAPQIYHYARSFEKFMLKMRSWNTASHESSGGYDMYNYLDRTSGYLFDNAAVGWGCQLRDVLRNRTGEAHYVRPGDFWYKNPEFGRTVSDPRKRGRNGGGFGKILGVGRYNEMNPYPPGDTYQLAHRAYKPPEKAQGGEAEGGNFLPPPPSTTTTITTLAKDAK